MYADDTTLYFTLQDFPSYNLEEIVNYKLGKITNWLIFYKLSLNTTKTKSLMFHTKQRHMDAVSFTINKENIKKISSFNFLGILLNENLTWNRHIDMLTNKVSKSFRDTKQIEIYISSTYFNNNLQFPFHVPC